MKDKDIQNILDEADKFLDGCDGVLNRSYLDFPGYVALYEDPQGTVKSICEHQGHLSQIGQWHTKISQFRLRIAKLIKFLEGQSTDYQKVKVLLKEMNFRLSTLMDMEKIFFTRRGYLEHAITSLRSIQSTYTERGQFLKYAIGG